MAQDCARPRVVAVLLAAALLAAACGGSSTSSDGTSGASVGGADITVDAGDPEPGGVLRFAVEADASGYDPANDYWNLSQYQIARAVYDPMFARAADGTPEPYLLKSAESNEDFTVWTLELRPGVMFHDGTPLDAEALKINIDAGINSPVLGFAWAAAESSEVVDDLTVQVNMKVPWSTFPESLTAQPGYVAAPSVFEPGGNVNPVGTGPFKLVEREPNTKTVFEKNENYWREGYPLLDGVEFQIVPDSLQRRSALESGDVDIIQATSAANVSYSEQNPDYQVLLDEDGETIEELMFFNTSTEPFDDQNARDAVAFGIDRELMSDQVFGGRYDAATGPFEENSPWYADVGWASFDPARAQEAADAYEADHGTPLSFTLLTLTDPNSAEVATFIQEQLAGYGINMEIKTEEQVSAIVNVVLGKYQAGTFRGLWGSPHPDREWAFLHSGEGDQGGINITRYESDTLDDSLDAARQTDDPDEQIAAWVDVQTELAAANTWVFLAHDDVGDIANLSVQDAITWDFPDETPGESQIQNVLHLYQIWLADA